MSVVGIRPRDQSTPITTVDQVTERTGAISRELAGLYLSFDVVPRLSQLKQERLAEARQKSLLSREIAQETTVEYPRGSEGFQVVEESFQNVTNSQKARAEEDERISSIFYTDQLRQTIVLIDEKKQTVQRLRKLNEGHNLDNKEEEEKKLRKLNTDDIYNFLGQDERLLWHISQLANQSTFGSIYQIYTDQTRLEANPLRDKQGNPLLPEGKIKGSLTYTISRPKDGHAIKIKFEEIKYPESLGQLYTSDGDFLDEPQHLTLAENNKTKVTWNMELEIPFPLPEGFSVPEITHLSCSYILDLENLASEE